MEHQWQGRSSPFPARESVISAPAPDGIPSKEWKCSSAQAGVLLSFQILLNHFGTIQKRPIKLLKLVGSFIIIYTPKVKVTTLEK